MGKTAYRDQLNQLEHSLPNCPRNPTALRLCRLQREVSITQGTGQICPSQVEPAGIPELRECLVSSCPWTRNVRPLCHPLPPYPKPVPANPGISNGSQRCPFCDSPDRSYLQSNRVGQNLMRIVRRRLLKQRWYRGCSTLLSAFCA